MLAGLFLLTGMGWGQLNLALTRARDYGDPPESRVYDPDNVFRLHQEELQEISVALKELKAKHDFDAYVIVFSGLIGSNVVIEGEAAHQKWLAPENDGLIFTIDIQNPGGGDTGRSRQLYAGDFMERGLMPRILMADLEDLIGQASETMGGDAPMEEKIRNFTLKISELIADRLQANKEAEPGKEALDFMGWMALAFLGVGLLMAILSKVLGRAQEKAARVYRFPDVLVGERLGAPNGGGKITWTDYGSQSGQ